MSSLGLGGLGLRTCDDLLAGVRGLELFGVKIVLSGYRNCVSKSLGLRRWSQGCRVLRER